jgi:hypothetical protein
MWDNLLGCFRNLSKITETCGFIMFQRIDRVSGVRTYHPRKRDEKP